MNRKSTIPFLSTGVDRLLAGDLLLPEGMKAWAAALLAYWRSLPEHGPSWELYPSTW